MFGEFFEQIIVVAKDFHGDIGADAFEHFVEAHFNRLRDEHVSPFELALDFVADKARQFGLPRHSLIDFTPLRARVI